MMQIYTDSIYIYYKTMQINTFLLIFTFVFSTLTSMPLKVVAQLVIDNGYVDWECLSKNFFKAIHYVKFLRIRLGASKRVVKV